jgi:hypothetical protein
MDLRGNISTRLKQCSAYADDILITTRSIWRETHDNKINKKTRNKVGEWCQKWFDIMKMYNWKDCIQDRHKWKLIVEKAKTFNDWRRRRSSSSSSCSSKGGTKYIVAFPLQPCLRERFTEYLFRFIAYLEIPRDSTIIYDLRANMLGGAKVCTTAVCMDCML